MTILIDMRSREEAERDPLPGSVVMDVPPPPLSPIEIARTADKLYEVASRFRPGETFHVFCAKGKRSALAEAILTQAGYDAEDLGGLLAANPPWRRNADERLRELERKATVGDEEAAKAAVSHRLRTGTATVQWLVGAGPSAFREFPLDLQVMLLRVALQGSRIDPDYEILNWRTRNPEEWFPEHEDDFECPRGHRVADTRTQIISLDDVWLEVFEVTEHGVMAFWPESCGDNIPTELQSAIFWCGECNAHWPVSGEVAVEL